MRTTLLFACFTLFSTAIASASTCIPGGTLSSYIALGSNGCTVGNTLFNDFESLAIPFGATQIDPATVTITPIAGSFDQTLQFNIGAFVNNGNFSDIDIGFHATAAPNLLAGSQVQLIAPSFTGDGSVTAIHDACPNGSFDPGLTCSTSDVNAIVTDTSALTDLLEGTAFAPAKTAAFFTDIGLDPGLSGTASVRAVSVTVNSIPEPAELGFLSGAGAALVLLSRLRRGRN